MSESNLDLASLFQAVTGVLGQNKESLNQADDYNHNHGDNMVQIFQAITQAMEEKKDLDPADQLAYASQLVRTESSSGSAAVYSEGLSDAARLFAGKQVDQGNVMQLVSALLGAQQQTPAADEAQDPLGGLVGSLLSGLTGQETSQKETSGFDAGDLLQAGMAFMQARQRGDSPVEAVLDAIMQNSRMSSSAHRSQSGKLVASTLLQMIGSLGQK